MSQKGFLLDLKRCTGCKACQVACKAENNTRPQRGSTVHGASVDYRRVVFSKGTETDPSTLTRRFVSTACYHCTTPACVPVCPVGAISKRSTDGVVLVSYDLCIGCRRCYFACPYGAPRYNGAMRKTQKCTFCEHLLEEGRTPACVATCVAKALLKIDDMPQTDLVTATGNSPEDVPLTGGYNGPNQYSRTAVTYATVLGTSVSKHAATRPNVAYAATSGGVVEQK